MPIPGRKVNLDGQAQRNSSKDKQVSDTIIDTQQSDRDIWYHYDTLQRMHKKPYWMTPDTERVRLYWGDVIEILQTLPSQSVQCVVTSPPYWGLRDYGTDKTKEIGSEETPEEFIAKMVVVFREVRRVLRDDGTLWLNLGDTYHDGGQLVGIPWRVALALQADGWVLRSDIPWVKRNAMPESVTNRPAKALEYVFMLTKGMRYFYDGEAIKQKTLLDGKMRDGFRGGENTRYVNNRSYDNQADATSGNGSIDVCSSRNFRQSDLWFDSTDTPHGLTGVNDELVGLDVTSFGYPGAHFATFPPKLIEPMIKAGTSEKGCCPKCGTPWQREVERRNAIKIEGDGRKEKGMKIDRSFRESRNGVDSTLDSGIADTYTVGGLPGCECGIEETIPCVVLDPFMGAATTAIVCMELERYVWGVELNDKYIRCNQVPRIQNWYMQRPAYRSLSTGIWNKGE